MGHRRRVLDGSNLYAMRHESPDCWFAPGAYSLDNHIRIFNPHPGGASAEDVAHLGSGERRALFCAFEAQRSGAPGKQSVAQFICKKNPSIVESGIDVNYTRSYFLLRGLCRRYFDFAGHVSIGFLDDFCFAHCFYVLLSFLLPEAMVRRTLPRTVREFVLVRWPRVGNFLR